MIEERVDLPEVETANLPARLLVILAGLVLLGLGGIGASVVVAQKQDTATKQDVERSQTLTQQLAHLTEKVSEAQDSDAKSAVTFRNDGRRLSVAICEQLQGIAKAVGAKVPPCPDVPVPTSSPIP